MLLASVLKLKAGFSGVLGVRHQGCFCTVLCACHAWQHWPTRTCFVWHRSTHYGNMPQSNAAELALLASSSGLQVWEAEHKGMQQELVDEGDVAAVRWGSGVCVRATCCSALQCCL